MTRLGVFAALVAVGTYGGMLLKSEPPKASAANAPQITAAVSHGDATVSPVRWGRFGGGWGGYYSPYYGGYSSYYGPGYGYYSARPYLGGYGGYGGYGYGYNPYYSWWW